MSSDKAPEKLYYCDLVKTPMLYHCGGDPHQVHIYIREDLVPKPDHIADASKMVDEQQRRREMFEKVAAKYAGFIMHSYDMNENNNKANFIKTVTQYTELILSEADKFAKGGE